MEEVEEEVPGEEEGRKRRGGLRMRKSHLVGDLDDEVAPEEVEDEEGGEEKVEDIVGREHGEDLASLNTGHKSGGEVGGWG